MEKHVKPAMKYYEEIIDKIISYFFCDALAKFLSSLFLTTNKNPVSKKTAILFFPIQLI